MKPSDLRDFSATKPLAESGWGPVILVWGIWAAMLVAVFIYITSFGSTEMPRAEEWVSVHEPLTPSWIWSQYHEHRVPLMKLLWLGTLKLTGYNFRVGHFITALALGAMAAGWIVGARRLRGHTAYTDAFFPLAVLSFSQGISYVWWWQVNTILAPIMASIFLIIVVCHGADPTLRQVVWAGMCLVILPFCGPGGLPYALLLSLWLFAWAWREFGSDREDRLRNSLASGGLGLAALAATALYFVGYESRLGETTMLAEASGGVTWKQVLDTTLQILSITLGSGTRPFWLWCGWAVFTLGAVTAGLLVHTWIQRPDERLRALVMFLFLGTGLGLLIRVAQARAVLTEHYVFTMGHYATMGVPLLACVYLAWQVYGSPILRRLVSICLLAAVLGFFTPTVQSAWDLGSMYVLPYHDMLRNDLNEETTIPILAERYPDLLPGPHHYTPDEAEAIFRQAALIQKGMFRRMLPGPDVHEVPLSVRSAKTNRIRWQENLAIGTGTQDAPATLTYKLSKPQFVHAIRLRFAFVNFPGEHAIMTVTFNLSEAGAARLKLSLNPGVEQRILAAHRQSDRCTIIVNRTMDEFTIMPDPRPFRLRLDQVSVLVPDAE